MELRGLGEIEVVGFTGTRQGMTQEQKKVFSEIIDSDSFLYAYEFHHGDCVGADEQAHAIVVQSGLSVTIHPPVNSTFRAFCKEGCKEIEKARPYLERNQDIVDRSDVLIAMPKEPVEVPRSGTWATIRYAKKREIPVILVLPDGEVKVRVFREEK